MSTVLRSLVEKLSLSDAEDVAMETIISRELAFRSPWLYFPGPIEPQNASMKLPVITTEMFPRPSSTGKAQARYYVRSHQDRPISH